MSEEPVLGSTVAADNVPIDSNHWLPIIGIGCVIILIVYCIATLTINLLERRRQRQLPSDIERSAAGSKYGTLERTPTFYQWNRLPPPPLRGKSSRNNKKPVTMGERPDNWQTRREELLKKYAASDDN